ncbi:MAG: PorP/SprF family type IX secretion system membrane protein [Bacteroidales bacterium]|nr:PorP/SprF family type IX secretion system membrane protein [Bacteroidales bacterium]
MKTLITTIALIFTVLTINAQSIYFSQYYADKLSLNPALSAIPSNSEISMILRHQFPTADGGYKTYCASYLQNLGRCGVGVRAYGTAGGAFRRHHFSASYANAVTIARNLKCSAAIEGSYSIGNLKQNELVYYSMLDPLNGSVNSNQPSIDYTPPSTASASAALALCTPHTAVGVAAFNIAKFKIEGDDVVPTVFTVFANHKISLVKGVKKIEDGTPCLIPSLMYRRQNDINTIQAGVYIDNTPVMGGISYRIQTNDNKQHTLIATIGTTIKHIQIGYGHDFDLSAITKSTYGSHEIAVKYKLNDGKKNNRRETIICPAF